MHWARETKKMKREKKRNKVKSGRRPPSHSIAGSAGHLWLPGWLLAAGCWLLSWPAAACFSQRSGARDDCIATSLQFANKSHKVLAAAAAAVEALTRTHNAQLTRRCRSGRAKSQRLCGAGSRKCCCTQSVQSVRLRSAHCGDFSSRRRQQQRWTLPVPSERNGHHHHHHHHKPQRTLTQSTTTTTTAAETAQRTKQQQQKHISSPAFNFGQPARQFCFFYCCKRFKLRPHE